jgi:two-component system NarL family response regulator
MKSQIRILIIHNEVLTRIGIKTVLEKQNDFEIIAEAENNVKGFELFKELKPDVVILSLRLPESCAVDDLDKYFAENKRARIIVLADHAGDAEITKSLKKGALGYICKDVSEEDLIKAVRVVNAGNKYIPSEIASVLSENLGAEELTKTETRVLQMVVGGMSNKEISFALDVSENTTKTHVKNIFDKLGVSDRTTATTTAIKRGLVRIDV